MNEVEFKDAVKRLKQVNEVVAGLDESLRARAIALLEPYLAKEAGAKKPSTRVLHADVTNDESADDAEFFSKREQKKPADRVYLIAAYLFSQFGAGEFTTDELKAIAARIGLTVPNRVDMTLSNAADKGKRLFRRTGKGKFTPTVTGEEYMKAQFEVKKGTKKKAAPVKTDDAS